MSTSVRRGLYGKLAGDGTLNALLAIPPSGYSKSIYFQMAPDTASFPFIVFQKTSGVPTDTMTVPAFMDTDTWLVKGIDRSASADNVEAIAERVKALLNDAVLSLSGTSLLYLRRQSDVEYPEVEGGVVYHHCGSLFRLVTG